MNLMVPFISGIINTGVQYCDLWTGVNTPISTRRWISLQEVSFYGISLAFLARNLSAQLTVIIIPIRLISLIILDSVLTGCHTWPLRYRESLSTLREE